MTEKTAACKTHVTIRGEEVTDFVTQWEYSTGIDDNIDTAKLLLVKSAQDAVTINNGDEVIIKRGKDTGQEYFIFRGNISTKRPKGAFLEIAAKDKLATLDDKEITGVFEDSLISTIATSLIETHGGLTGDVEISGEGTTLNRFICNHDKIFERLQKLRKILNWTLWYDPENDKVVFKNKGTNIHNHIIRYNVSGTTNTGGILRWEWNTEHIVNSVTLVGGPVLDWRKETFNGDGSTTEFTLSQIPEIIEVEHPSGTRKTMGITDGPSGDYTVDKSNKKIIFETAPASGTNNVIVNYAIYVPVTVQRKDEVSIDTYGLSEDTFYYPDILTVTDAEIKAQEILDRFSRPIPSANFLEIEQSIIPIRPGDSVKVEDDINDVHRYLTVTRITYKWPTMYDIVDLGQETIQDRITVREIEERISKLEKREAQNISFVNIVADLPDTLRGRAELEVQDWDVSYDGAWGIGFGDGTTKKTYTWGESGGLWQGSYTNSPVTMSICHQDNQYEEEFVDTRFVISDETTATVDVTNNKVVF